ncbi:MAG: ureidoglycolate lyase [Candidatus Woesebacteria bacterium]|nr:ureidoglycolate lyase [Candidatus Woesebacteria bacterium]
MKNTIKIKVEELNIETFKPFGQIVLGPVEKPNYKDISWKSLFPVAQIHLPQGELGWVISKKPKKGMIIEGMEREPEIEIIWPVDKPIIQVVSIPGNLSDHSEQPNAKSTKAFLIKPGQVIIMKAGTWHYAAFPAGSKEVFYYFMTKDHPREPGWKDVAWVPFKDEVVIEIEN